MQKSKKSVALQSKIATASFCAAVAFSIAGFVVPPIGDLTEANLYLVAQFLLVTTSIFGVSSIVSKQRINTPSVDEEKPLARGAQATQTGENL